MDIKTMYLVLAIGYLVFGLMLFIFQRYDDPARRIPFWAMSKLLQALGLFLMACRGLIPDLLSVALGNSLLLCGFAYEAWAWLWVSGRVVSRRVHLSWAVVICLVSFSFLFLEMVPRLVIASCFQLLNFGLAGWALVTFRGGKLPLATYLGWNMGGAAVVMAARAAWALFDPQSVTLFSASLVQQIGALSVYYLLLTSGFGILLLAKQTADRDLRATLEEQVKIMETLPTGLCILQNRVIQRCNPAMETIYGFPAGTLLGRSTRVLYADEADFEAFGRQIYHSIQQRNRFEGEVPFVRQAGERFWAKVQGASIFPERGQSWAVFSITDITEQKKLEAALRASEAKFKTILETSPDGIATSTLDGQLQFATAKLAAMLGYASPDELLGRSVREFIHPSYQEKVDFLLAEMFHGRLMGAAESLVVRKDGSFFYVEANANLLLNAEQQPVGILYIVRNITERKQVEAQLRESEAKFREMAELLPQIVFEADAAGRLTYVNQQAYRILGYPADYPIQGMNTLDLYPPADRSRAIENIRRRLAGEQEGSHEYTLQRLDGSLMPVLVYSNPILHNNQPVGLRGIIVDITERKQAEEALRESDEKFRSLLDSQESNILVLDFDGVHHYVNQVGVVSLTGSGTAQDILGKRLHDLYPSEAADWQLEQIRRVMTTGQGISGDFEAVVNHQASWWHLNLQPIRNALGQVVQVMVNSLDISERKRIEAELYRLNAELEERVEARTAELREAQEKLVRQEKLAVLGQLAGSVGHELRNPLSVIHNAIYFLRLAQPGAPDKVLEYLGMIDSEAHSAEKIINDLLEFSRAKSVDLEPLAVSDLVERTLARFPLPEAVRLNVNLPDDLPKIFVDPGQVTQVFGNLVLNACQAMPNGGEIFISAVPLFPQAAASQPADFVRLTVRDTGVGITPENLKKIFEPLFTTKPKGIGLGLAVSQKLIEANGGRIEVSSEPGQGAVFSLTFPTHEAQDD